VGRSQYDAISNLVDLQREGGIPLQEQLLAFFRDSIGKGWLRAGSRLPSSRRLAERLGISRTTVVEAYDRLACEGYVESRPRAGVFVAPRLHGGSRPFPGKAAAGGRRVHHGAAMRTLPDRGPSFASEHDLPLAPGIPAIDRFPWNVWSQLSVKLCRTAASRLVSWGDPRGELPLREAIAEYLGVTRGIGCSPEQIIVASGSQPLVETFTRAIAHAGDRVWFEEPGDPASRGVLRAMGLETVPVPVDDKGIDVEAGRLAAANARFAIVAPSHHYPLGFSMSLTRRKALLDWAEQHEAWIVENEIDADYRFVPGERPTLHSLDTAGRVIYLGSFNKALGPGLRIGYAVLPERLLGALRLTAQTVSVANQLLLARFWSSGHLAAHLRELREVHARRRAVLLAALRTDAGALLDTAPLPEAGLRLPVTLPPEVSDLEVASACPAAGIKVGRPFSSCYLSGRGACGMTIGFASTPEEQIGPAVAKLAAVIRASEAVPRRLLA
jgi:GntR family transcriptional regulator / MocR family aminotransferase